MLDQDKLERLCTQCVDAWDLDTLVSYAVEAMYTYYVDNQDDLCDFLQSLGEECPYCGDICPLDSEHACDRWKHEHPL